MKLRVMLLLTVLFSTMVVGSTSSSNLKSAEHPWAGPVRVDGALRAMMHEGQTQATVKLDTLLPDARLYALGALADLAGEVTVIGGAVYLSYPADSQKTRTEKVDRTSAGAALLVSTDVESWQSIEIDHVIAFEKIDEEIARLAELAGMQTDGRIPFLLEGEFENLEWHVIDGQKLPAGGTSHDDHKAAAVTTKSPRASATLVGFFSEKDQGVFTHMNSRTHIHCVVGDPLASGHVDHVDIPAGTILKFPI